MSAEDHDEAIYDDQARWVGRYDLRKSHALRGLKREEPHGWRKGFAITSIASPLLRDARRESEFRDSAIGEPGEDLYYALRDAEMVDDVEQIQDRLYGMRGGW